MTIMRLNIKPPNNRLDSRPGLTVVWFGKGDYPGGSAVALYGDEI